MNDLRPYPRMKDSGVQWLGEVPAHWEVRQLGRMGRFFKGNGGTKADETEEGTPCVRYGDLYTRHSFHITETRSRVDPLLAETAYTPIQHGDVLFAGSGETVGEIGKSAANLMRGPACCGGDVIVFRSTSPMNPAFLGYATDCLPAAQQKARMGSGFTVFHIYGVALKRLYVAMPPVVEQAAIERFLAHATSRIDRYIRTKEKLLDLLEGQQQAVIEEVVTGHLRASGATAGAQAPPSPNHAVKWPEVRLKSVITAIRIGPFGSQLHASDYTFGGTPVVNPSHMAGGSILPDAGVSVDSLKAEELSIHRLRVNDVVMARRGELGRCALVGVGEEGWICGTGSLRVTPNLAVVLPAFLALCLGCRSVKDELAAASIGATMDNLNADIVSRLRIPLPHLPDQAAIVGFLTDATARLAAASDGVRHQIAAMSEYRRRLTADVATGKLDVREAGARLPNEPDDPSTLGSDHSPLGAWKDRRSPGGNETYQREEAIP